MKVESIAPFVVLVLVLAVVARRRKARSDGAAPAPPGGRRSVLERLLGDAGLIAERELRDRVRGRIFRIGTLLILVAVVLSIQLTSLHKNTVPTERVGVVGAMPASEVAALRAASARLHLHVHLVHEPSPAVARSAVHHGTLDLAVVGRRRVVVKRAISADPTSTTSELARDVATTLGDEAAIQAAHLSPAQVARLRGARPLPVTSLKRPVGTTAQVASFVGLELLLLMFITYNTWILTGVMEEKATRVVEVLLSAVRPIQLLAGKVLGIGLVALGQAGLIVAVALLDARASGSSLAKGSTPLFVGSILLWLLIGYAFYCWVYAAAGSMAERRDQIQTLAVPLSLPVIVGYVVALGSAGSGSASELLRILAYLPPTAPFAMPTLVSLHAVAAWQFVASIAVSLASTVVVARFAAGVYRRSVLRTGQRVRLKDVVGASAR